MRQRVVAYVTRKRDGVEKPLVFDDRDRPRTETQIPAGRLHPAPPRL